MSLFEDRKYRQICSEKTLQSNSEGFFLEFSDYVAKNVGQKWIESIFGSLKSDRDRIKCIFSAREIKPLVEDFLSNVQEVFRGKSSEEFAQKKLSEADDLMNNGEFNKALIIYSQSVIRAPISGLALWKRAQVLLKLRKFSNALCDIQQALKEHLPDHFKAEAFWKMGICYESLKEINRAKVSYELAQKLLKHNSKKIQTLVAEKENLLIQIEDSNTDDVNNLNRVPATVLGGNNPNLPYASKKLTVKSSNSNLGRFIVAAENISAGEILVVEPPFVACLFSDMFGTHCHHCFKRLESPYACPDCISVAFCTIECRDKAINSYHKFECKFLDLLIGSGMSVLAYAALRILTQNGLTESLRLYENRHNERFFQLCTNADLRGPADFLQRTLMAAFLLKILQKSHFFIIKDSLTSTLTENEIKIGEMLLFNLQMLQFNAHEIYETRIPANKAKNNGSKISFIGIAAYLTSSLFNHDCHPALSRYFIGKNIVLSSCRPLKRNEAVPENYGPVFTRKTLAERKRSLSSRYWFDCRCTACLQNWPCIERGLENVSQRIRCVSANCNYLFTLPLTRKQIKCPQCKNDVDLTESEKMLKLCYNQYNNSRDLNGLSQAIDNFYKISSPPAKETQVAEEMLSLILASNK